MASTPSAGTYVATEFRPEWSVPPGNLIQRELELSGFTQADIAARANLSAKHLNQLLRSHVALSPEVAIALERVLGVPGDLWLRMDATWQAARLREAGERNSAKHADWLGRFPAQELEARGVAPRSGTVASRVEQMLRFFGVVDPAAFERVWLAPQANYRRSQKFTVDPYSTALWLRLAERAALDAAPAAGDFDPQLLRALVARVPALTRLPIREGFAQATRLLGSAGVLLVFVPEVEKTRIVGASWWLHAGKPVVALSGRQKFVDIFWFTLLHEIGHVLMHQKRATFLDLERKGEARASDDEDAQETAADAFAQRSLISPREAARVASLQAPEELKALAAEVGVSEGIIAGRFGHETGDWKTFGKFRESGDLAVLLAAS